MRGSGILKDEAPGANASICLKGSSFALRSPIKQSGGRARGGAAEARAGAGAQPLPGAGDRGAPRGYGYGRNPQARGGCFECESGGRRE